MALRVKKWAGQEIAHFQRTENFKQNSDRQLQIFDSRLWLLKVSILPLNFPKWGLFRATNWISGQTFLNKNIFWQMSDSP